MSYKSDRPTFHERLDHFVNVIRTDILNGIRQEGTYLPSESALAKQYQLSNKSIRKGLDQLVEEGLIVKIDRVGSMVTPHSRESVTINYGCPLSLTSDFMIDDLIAEFSRRNPGIHVRRITLNPLGYVRSAEEMMQNGLLDVVAFNSSQFQEWNELGLTPLLEELGSDKAIYPITESAFRIEDKVYARPVSFSPVVLCYNKQHFRDADIPEPDSYWSWDDLIDATSQLAKSRGRHGIYFLPASENRYSIFLLQGGKGKKELPDGSSRLNMLEGLDKLNELINNRLIFPNYWAQGNDETIRLFAEGQVSTILATYFNLNEFAHMNLEYDICPLPSLHRGDPQKTLMLSIGTALVHHSPSKEAASRFMEFLSSADAQMMIRDKTISIPARKEAAEATGNQGGLNRPSRYSMFREMLPSYAYHKEIGLQMQTLRMFSRFLKEYWSGMIDVNVLYDKLEYLAIQSEVGEQTKPVVKQF
ncbi:extracellular solute-binding protein [Paenibacillus dokdonensis]|uniref:extracellular solute-binding protein n=1 Tax=Paenibacillus dokdonensis TaxID=2567944 RepID=UPI0010A919B9|nr:extracellular solute-binding protein [Paenibacillus dokdonensis]